jgi:hypothetical protein
MDEPLNDAPQRLPLRPLGRNPPAEESTGRAVRQAVLTFGASAVLGVVGFVGFVVPASCCRGSTRSAQLVRKAQRQAIEQAIAAEDSASPRPRESRGDSPDGR